ncbi:MAG: GDSL-type esterase/lipase family protein [Planctomycetaceae bacterium]
MVNRPFALWLLMICLTTGSFRSGCAQDTPSPPANEKAVSEQTVWLRQLIQVSGSMNGSSAELRLNGTGVVSVYFNGQRLAARLPISGTVAWPVQELLRPGRNCIAVSASVANQEKPQAAWLEAGANVVVEAVGWRITADRPPIGWQQTDFNDRDWTGAGPAASIKAVPGDVQRLTWANRSQREDRLTSAFRFQDGDHVLLVGGTFIERAQLYGHLEGALTANAGNLRVTFRNLGWSADTVFAESRGIFDAPARGYERLIEQVRAEEPTVIMVCYGQNEALSSDGSDDSLERFRAQLTVLQRDLASTGAEVVFWSPHPFVDVAPPIPPASRFNSVLKRFSGVVRQVATATQCRFVDLFDHFTEDLQVVQSWASDAPMPPELRSHPDLSAARNRQWTDNGMHWNDAGYRCVSALVAARLFDLPLHRPAVSVDAQNSAVTCPDGTIQKIVWNGTPGQRVSFEFLPSTTALFVPEIRVSESVIGGIQAELSTPGLTSPLILSQATIGSETLFSTTGNPAMDQVRALIVRKNELYFHRWRPQNITYLFGFRKHEQGNNAGEIAQFDPLIDELEQQIHIAAQPVPVQIRLTSDAAK